MKKLTLRQFAAEWSSGSGGNFCSPVWERDRKKLLKRLLETDGDIFLEELTPKHLWNVQRRVLDAGLTIGTMNLTTAAMMGFIRDAELEDYLPEGRHREFQAKVRYRRNRNTAKRFRPWTNDQRSTILTLFAEHQPHWLPFVEFQFYTGCRVSEAIAIDWDVVDLEQGFIRVVKSWTQGLPGRCKTPRSVRLVKLCTYLRERLALVPDSERTGPVFKTPRGCRINENNFSQRIWHRTIAKAADRLPKQPPRCSRHTFTSLAVEFDTPMPDVARITGDRIEMIERAYVEYTKEFRLLDMDAAAGARTHSGGPSCG